MSNRSYFISDNAAGVHPEVLSALAAANSGHAIAYGNDAWTARAGELLRQHFGHHAEIFLMLTGTGANVLALACALEPWQAVICADCAHLYRDECGAPEKFAGVKLLPARSSGGKLTPESIAPLLRDNGMVHRVQPRVVTVSQCTEWGTVYTPEELGCLAAFCHSNDLLLHVDGARLCNAAAALDASLSALTTDCGVDMLSFGGTKNGLMGAEALVFLEPSLARAAGYYRKQAMQLGSKMRFVAAQFEALLANDLWLRSARHANAMAHRLAAALASVDAVEIVMPVESNAIFARMPLDDAKVLQETHVFAVWDSEQSIVRWMTAFDTTEDEVDEFAERISAVTRKAG